MHLERSGIETIYIYFWLGIQNMKPDFFPTKLLVGIKSFIALQKLELQIFTWQGHACDLNQ